MWWSPQQACRSGVGAQDCVVRIRRAHRIFTKPGERKSLTDYDNVKDDVITLRPTAMNDAFRIGIVVGLAQNAAITPLN